MPPVISIISPVQNQENYIAECLESMIQQTFQDWELIIIDDHSTDSTLSIIQTHQRQDQRIKCYPNKDKGIISALQLALENTNGEFITRIDGDDIMPKDRLAVMLDAISKSTEKTIVTGKVKYFSNQAISEGYLVYEYWLNERVKQNDHWKWVYRECVIASPNWMCRKADLLNIHAFGELTYPEDYHLVLKWYENNFQVKSIPNTTLHWREHENRTSRKSDHYNQEHFFRLKIQHLISTVEQGNYIILWGTGVKGKLAAQMLEANAVPFEWMDLQSFEREYNGHQILPYTTIESRENFVLLLSIFPNEKERIQLESYLAKNGLAMGKDYWYL